MDDDDYSDGGARVNNDDGMGGGDYSDGGAGVNNNDGGFSGGDYCDCTTEESSKGMGSRQKLYDQEVIVTPTREGDLDRVGRGGGTHPTVGEGTEVGQAVNFTLEEKLVESTGDGQMQGMLEFGTKVCVKVNVDEE